MTAVHQWLRDSGRRSDPGDPYWANVVLLAPLSASQPLVDVKGLQTLGATGDVTADGPVLFGQASSQGFTSSDYVNVTGINLGLFLFPDDTAFTLEVWANHSSLAGIPPQAFCGGNIGWEWYTQPSATPGGGMGLNTTNGAHGSQGFTETPITTGTWHHFAVTREADGTMRGFTDGVHLTTATPSMSLENGPISTFRIGGNYNAFPYPFLGALRELRITRGVARYTADFTPPTRAFPQHG